MKTSDTIAAIATAHGIGSIAIVRVSGSDALNIAKTICAKENFEPRRAILSDIYDFNKELIDRGIVIYFKAPFSFTGEDIVEFQCHGGVTVAKMVLDAVCEAGARVAMPGEFSKRAFLNGKIDLDEAEAIAKLIEARSEDAAKILARHLKGDLKKAVEKIREDLIRILAYAEVNIDYAEEDLPQDMLESMLFQLEEILQNLKRMIESSKRRQALLDGFKIAIIGKPNTGKSSLLNALLSYERAIVSDIAGTTRDTIEESIKIGTHLVRIVDTAGIRDTLDEIEKVGVKRSLEAVRQSDIVLAMFDLSREFDKEDMKILEILKKEARDKEVVVLLNKADLPQKSKESLFEGYITLKLSVKQDISPLIDKLKEILDSYGRFEETILINKRQTEAAEKALEELLASKAPLEENELEIFALHINEALKNLAMITRPMESGELLDKMFGEFCLGK